MIRAYSDSPDPFQSLSLFLAMHLQDANFAAPRPDKFTYPFVFKACSKLKDARMGKQVHGLVWKIGFGLDRYVCNALIHMYSECGELGCARNVFDGMPERDVVSWSSMVDGCMGNGKTVEALEVFCEMEGSGVEPNDATVVSVLRACAETGALEMGRRVHRIVQEKELDSMANVNTALIDMYSKSGCIDSARRVFDGIASKDVYSWTAMIHGLASHGMCKEALHLFGEMERSGVKPDDRTMTAVLSACRNAGWVTEGYEYFKNMRGKYSIRPNIQHHGCVVDLYARAGRLEEAEDFIRKMRIQPDAVLWRALIWACKLHGDTDRAERLIKEMDINPKDCDSFVLLGNVYASAGKWQDKGNVRKAMLRGGLLKPPGSSKIEVDGVVHEFIVGDSSHPEARSVYQKLDEIEERLRGEGYEPEVSEVLLEIEDEEKAFQLLHHSEKLAVAFGLIRTKPGSQIRIVKNLRSCEDCHIVMKLISKVYGREIVVRDRIRFHHFKEGTCSCGDYW